ncbi:hypothetical protein JM658_14170 [Joostella atrarenae]|uniref:Uncharacterized protein n=1 Tax=Joostella atrarenae TaxID=679257 RepID=A0ABS9J6F0_9FLAO|nr:hypothetical protein [Joostella atrarenae]MCF8715979.1 hypothetical protein [Joostella atrarenae]
MRNVITTKLSNADESKINSLVDQLEKLINGKLTALTEDERIKYGSINEQNKLLVNKVFDFNKRSPELSTKDVDWIEFKKDFESRSFLENTLERIKSVAYQMESTKTLHDYDNYQDALLDYSHAQYKKGAGANGYTEKVADLKQFFPRTRKKQEDENES